MTANEKTADLTDVIATVYRALEPLESETRERVLAAVRALFGFTVDERTSGPQQQAHTGLGAQVASIRALREQKRPRNAPQMAAIVAYYLLYEIPDTERKETITADDIDKYFREAGYPKPGRARNVLGRADDLGYLDRVGRGEYKLTHSGHNVVAHELPQGASESQHLRTRRKTRARARAQGRQSQVKRPRRRR